MTEQYRAAESPLAPNSRKMDWKRLWQVQTRFRTDFGEAGSYSRLAGLLLDNASRVLVLAKADKLRMPQPVDLRSILHPFMAWVIKSRAQRLLRDDWAQR